MTPMTVTDSLVLPLEVALQQAIAHHQAGRLPEAEQLYRAILRTRPDHPDAHHNLGVLAVQMKQPALGLPHFKAAQEANPDQEQYWFSYINALIQSGQKALARDILAQAQQRGLQREAVERLSGLLAGSERCGVKEASPAEGPHNKRQAGLKTKKTAKQIGKASWGKKAGELPSLQEMNSVVSLFDQGRYQECETLA